MPLATQPVTRLAALADLVPRLPLQGKWNEFAYAIGNTVRALGPAIENGVDSPAQVNLTSCRLYGGQKYRLFVYVEAPPMRSSRIP